jgi:DNA polymerase III, alpha subunit (gram-positive type)
LTYGALYWYYECPSCKKKFKYATDLFVEFGDDFGKCPACDTPGTFLKEGAISVDDIDFEEVD